MLIKLLANVLCGLLAVAALYSIFYFRLFPRLIAHYRKVVLAGRKYDKDIRSIQSGEQQDQKGDPRE